MNTDSHDTHTIIYPLLRSKHLINLLWIFADSGAYDYAGVGMPQLAAEFAVFGVVAPLVTAGLYYWLAATVHDEERGSRLLRRLHVALPSDVDEAGVVVPEAADVPAYERGNRTARPGHWIYSSFRHKGARVAFVVTPVAYSAIAAALLLSVSKVEGGNLPVQALLLVLILGVTPTLFAPGIVRRNRTAVDGAQKTALALLEGSHARVARVSAVVAAGARSVADSEALADSRKVVVSFLELMAADARQSFEELAAAVEHAGTNRRSQRRKRAKVKASQPKPKRLSSRASIASLASVASVASQE